MSPEAQAGRDAKPLEPVLTAHLFPKIEGMLLELLRSVKTEEWEVQTISPHWKVKDVAAHLLDTQLRKLSIARDSYVAEQPAIESPADLVAFVNRLNREGVAIYRRLSPRVLISLMEMASRENTEYHRSLDPFARAAFGVSWAGEETSANWFDTAREFTERWHHQQQIRLALDRPGIMTPELYHPVLDCFMRALPYRYRNVVADWGSVLRFDISGECGGSWFLQRGSAGQSGQGGQRGNAWRLIDGASGSPASRVTIPQEIAWRIFTKGINRDAAAERVRIEGNRELGRHILGLTAIIG